MQVLVACRFWPVEVVVWKRGRECVTLWYNFNAMRKYFYITTVLVGALLMAASCADDDHDIQKPAVEETEEAADELALERLTLEEKVAQMFIVTPELLSAEGSANVKNVDATMISHLRSNPVGGVILFGGNISTPEQVSAFISDIKLVSKYPPFIAVDEEGGRVARIGNNKNFAVQTVPAMYEIGATGNRDNAYSAGWTVGAYLKDYGFNLDFAPVADVFSNPDNTVIGNRAFGSSPEVVAPMVSACIDGLHAHGILTTLKHFPGHGDTSTDSHTSLPLVTKTWDELLLCEIPPFAFNAAKTDMIMTAHIAVSAVNETINGNVAPSTLSANMLTGKLRGELGYQGVIITDALRMAAITNFYATQGEAAVQAILAGVDIILCPGDFYGASGTYAVVLEAVKAGTIPESRIDQSVQRIIALKKKL